MDEIQDANSAGFLLLPSVSGGGGLVRRGQIVGARANGPDGGAIVYTAAGPAIYTSLTTKQLAALVDAQLVETPPRS